MKKDEKAQVIDAIAAQIEQADAVYAVDYRGLSVTQAAELRSSLRDAGATFRVVKNTLTLRAADKAGVEELKALVEEGPTALAFVEGDPALAAKTLDTFSRQAQVLDFKGGMLGGDSLTADQIRQIARLPGRDRLNAQIAGVVASPLTGLVRGLGSMLSGLVVALGQVAQKREAEAPAEPQPPAQGSESEAPAAEAPAAEAPAAEAPAAEAPEGEADPKDEPEGEAGPGEPEGEQPRASEEEPAGEEPETSEQSESPEPGDEEPKEA
jgi:large subunit ribosomal protein L10